jgi:hypothetical protein
MAESTRKISNKVGFVNYRDKDNRGRTANPGDDLDLSKLGDGEEERIEAAGGFADTEIPLTRRGSDMDGHTIVDDRDPEDTDTPVPAENGGVLPLDDEESDWSKQSKSDLEDEVERRNASGRAIEVEGTGSNGAVTKDDLVKALSEDDAAA